MILESLGKRNRDHPEDLYPSRGKAGASLLPRQDPVVYSERRADSPLTKEQTEFYRKNGYLVLRGVFNPAEIDHLQHRAASLLSNPQALDAETLIIERDGNLVRSIFEVHAQDAHFGRLSRDARLAEVAMFLLGDSIYVHQSRLNYKPGLRGKEFYWHSDFETWHTEDGMPRMRALSVSVLLSTNCASNGPLMVIPRSHISFIPCSGETPKDHYRRSLRQQEYGVPDDLRLAELVEANDIDTITGEAGTVVIFDCNLMHGSNGNITPWPRSNFFVVYNAVSNRLVDPFGAEKPRPEFIAARSFTSPIEPVGGRLVGKSG